MIQPFSDFVLIDPDEEATETKSGILLIKDTEKAKPIYGTVVAVGPGKEFSTGHKGEMEVSVGDRVAFEKYGGDPVEYEEKKYIIISQPRIFCKIV